MHLLMLLAATAFAQDPSYDGTAAAEDAIEKPETDLSAELGGTFTAGNAMSWTLNGGLKFAHKWGANRFGADAGVAMNQTVPDTDGNGTLSEAERDAGFAWASQRFFAQGRYDRFFGSKNSLYISAAGEQDVFAGFFWRFNQQIGYSRVLVDSETTGLNLEAGIAIAEENFVPTDVTADDGTVSTINDAVLDAWYPALRVQLDFSHAFNDNVSIGNTLEMFENLLTPVDFRLYNTTTLTARLSDMFSLKLSNRLAFDNQPVEGFQTVDNTVALTLVASIF